MRAITAIYENGVFRPTEPVDLPEGTPVRVEANGREPADQDLDSTPEQIEARRRVFEILSRSHDTGVPGNVLETHDDHQP